MALTYGFVNVKCVLPRFLKAAVISMRFSIIFILNSRSPTLKVTSGLGTSRSATGTNNADDPLKYKLVFDFRHPIIETLKATGAGFLDLTGKGALPTLDFSAAIYWTERGRCEISDVMDGSAGTEPDASPKRLLRKARDKQPDVYIFGRTCTG